MAPYRRGPWFWGCFTTEDGEYRRVALRDNRGKRIAYNADLASTEYQAAIRAEERAREKANRREEIRGRKLSFGRLPFHEAAEKYLEERRHGLARASIRSELERSRSPKAYFGNMALNRLTADNLREYIVWRKKQKPQRGDGEEISNRTVNMEVAFIRRLLKRARRLHLLADDLKALPERRDVGRALTPDEKFRLLKVAKQKPEWDNARLAMVLALNTTMRGCELRGLQWHDVDLMAKTLTVRRSKTAAGERVIALNADALATVLELRDRAKLLFGENVSPDWYVFPGGEGQGPKIGPNQATVKPDPTRPMTTWRSAWRALRAAAAKGDPEKGIPPLPRLARLRFHDLRHHAITELAETAASDQVIRSIAGHVSQRMLEHYSHVRLEAKRKALDALATKQAEVAETGQPPGGYVTKRVTKPESEGLPRPEVIEKTGGDDGTRTRDLMRDRHAF